MFSVCLVIDSDLPMYSDNFITIILVKYFGFKLRKYVMLLKFIVAPGVKIVFLTFTMISKNILVKEITKY